VTIATAERSRHFVEAGLTSACAALLTGQARDAGAAVYAYCFMPDHLHLLISPSPEMSIIEFVRRFKSLSTRLHWARGRRGPLWQQGFYDHFLRRDDDLRRVINYIVNNPVRAELVSDAAAYPFSSPNSSQE